jgi:hypothetical protein
VYARWARTGSLAAAIALSPACAPVTAGTERPPPRAPAVAAPAGETRSAAPDASTVTTAPLGPCELAEELPLVLGQYREAGSALERAAAGAPVTCEPGKPATFPNGTLFRLTTEAPVRFWATGGPYPDLSGQFPDVVIRVYRGCPGDDGSAVLACGSTVAEDLVGGKYFVAVAPASPSEALAKNPPAGALAYRIAAHGDTQCPEDLATRRLDDWMGESFPELRSLGDLNGDARGDVAVGYRAASNLPATRVLVADDYPRCLRAVLDDEVTLKLDGAASRGWKPLRTAGPAPAPNGVVDDLFVVRRATFDATLGRYVAGKTLGCSDEPTPDAKLVRCRAPRSGP